MGAGASAEGGGSGSGGGSRGADPHNHIRGPHKPQSSPRLTAKQAGKRGKVSPQDEQFQRLCLGVFQAVDVDQSGASFMLTRGRHCSAVLPSFCAAFLLLLSPHSMLMLRQRFVF